MNTTPRAARGLRHFVLAVSVLAFAVPAAQALGAPMNWGGGERVQGNGNVKKQSRELAHFTGVSLALPGNVELRIGATEGVTIETDENLLPLIETVIENGSLKIRPTKRNLNLDSRNMKIVVQAKAVDRIALSGSGSLESDALRGAKLQFDLGGSGSIKLKGIEGESVSVTVGGSGKLKAAGGWARKVSVSIGGSGDVDLGQVKIDDASVSLAGSGEATVWARDSLSVTITGSGDINYYGDPKLSTTVIGSGGAKRLGSAPR